VRENRNLGIGFFARAPVKHAGDRNAKVSLRGDEWDAEIAEIAAAPARRRS
jgi:hypothetical protein